MISQSLILQFLNKFRIYDSNLKKIRAGALRDGGYVIVDDCKGLEGVISIGIGNDVSFDMFFAQKNIPVYQYDHTIDTPPVIDANFIFQKKGLGANRGNNLITLHDILTDNNFSSNDLILKFDIEGDEWDSLSNIDIDLIQRFRFIVCELHWIKNAFKNLFTYDWHSKVVDTLTTDHKIVHMHINNYSGVELVEGVLVPEVIELTLLRNDRARFNRSHAPIPSELDFPNNPNRPDIILTPFCYCLDS